MKVVQEAQNHRFVDQNKTYICAYFRFLRKNIQIIKRFPKMEKFL